MTPSISRFRFLIGGVVFVVIIAAALIVRGDGGAAGAPVQPGLHVVGNRILDKSDRVVSLQGIDRSGTEYACIQGWGIFDGPATAQSVRAIASWHVNIVRVPINEDCWLGINGVKPQYASASYRTAIVNYVNLVHRYGMYAEVSLIWAAPGANRATYQPGGPDADHAPAVWSSMAATFKNDPNVILAPWGETVVDANCFLYGGVCEATYGTRNIPYRISGMEQAVTVMRAAGYKGIISIPGVSYANDLSHWLSREPKDPRHQLIAEAHVYGKNVCDTVRCFQATFAPVARRVPLLFAEVGESYDGSDCGTSHIAMIMGWADAHKVGYEAWTWDTWGNCSALIASYGGAPRGAYGTWVQDHYVARKARLLNGKP
ncbi:MAG: cellulase family glycosylhydrolase [Solirubrobacterales bacterium]|nr:cellulase family glycosylhydrolase [Solirubrobacterales bacterium]